MSSDNDSSNSNGGSSHSLLSVLTNLRRNQERQNNGSSGENHSSSFVPQLSSFASSTITTPVSGGPLNTTSNTTSSSVFQLSQSLDIINNALDFTAEFSPPHAHVPSSVTSNTQPSSENVDQPFIPLDVGQTLPGPSGVVPGNNTEEQGRSDEVGPSSQYSGNTVQRSSAIDQGGEEQDNDNDNNDDDGLFEMMETSRERVLAEEQARVVDERIRVANEQRRQVFINEQKAVFRRCCRVPGGDPSTTSEATMSSEGEESSNYRHRRRRGMVSDQVTPTTVRPPYCLNTGRKEPKEAALSSTTESTESDTEPAGVVPGQRSSSLPPRTKADKRPRRVPQQKRGRSEDRDLPSSSLSNLTHYHHDELTTFRRDVTPPLPSVHDDHTTDTVSSLTGDPSPPPPVVTNTSASTNDVTSSITAASGVTTTSESGISNNDEPRINSPSTSTQHVAIEPLISSTPDEHDFDSTASGGSHDMDHTPLNRMAPPIHPPLRHSSTDTSTTSSETSSSSSCLMTKVKSVVRIEGTSDEDTHRGMPPPPSGSTSFDSQSLLATATPSLDIASMDVTDDVIPSTPTTTEDLENMETQDIMPASSQDDLFQNSQNTSGSEPNYEMPQWITEQKSTSRNDQRRVVCYSSTSDSIGSSLSMEEGTSRHKRSHSASSSNSHNGDCSNDDGGSGSSVKKPSMKRQRLSVTPVSPDINEVPGWMKQSSKQQQQQQQEVYHSTPGGPHRSIGMSSVPSTPADDSPSIPSQTDKTPTIITSSGSYSSSSSQSVSSGSYFASVSSGGGSSGFTPPSQSIVTGEFSSSSSSLSTSNSLKKTDDETSNTNVSEPPSSDDHHTTDTDDQGAGGPISTHCDADESAIATSSNTNTPPLDEEIGKQDQSLCDDRHHHHVVAESSSSTTTTGLHMMSSSNDTLPPDTSHEDKGGTDIRMGPPSDIIHVPGNPSTEQDNSGPMSVKSPSRGGGGELMETESFNPPMNSPVHHAASTATASQNYSTHGDHTAGHNVTTDGRISVTMDTTSQDGGDMSHCTATPPGNTVIEVTQPLDDGNSIPSHENTSDGTVGQPLGDSTTSTEGTIQRSQVDGGTDTPVSVGVADCNNFSVTVGTSQPVSVGPPVGQPVIPLDTSQPMVSDSTDQSPIVGSHLSTSVLSSDTHSTTEVEDTHEGDTTISDDVRVGCTQESFALRLSPSQVLPSQVPSQGFTPVKMAPVMSSSITNTPQHQPMDVKDDGSHGNGSHDIVIDLTQTHSNAPLPVLTNTLPFDPPTTIDLTENDDAVVVSSTKSLQSATPDMHRNPNSSQATGSQSSIDCTSPMPKPVYESMQYSPVDDTPPMAQSSNVAVDTLDSNQYSSGTPIHFHLPNNMTDGRITSRLTPLSQQIPSPVSLSNQQCQPPPSQPPSEPSSLPPSEPSIPGHSSEDNGEIDKEQQATPPLSSTINNIAPPPVPQSSSQSTTKDDSKLIVLSPDNNLHDDRQETSSIEEDSNPIQPDGTNERDSRGNGAGSPPPPAPIAPFIVGDTRDELEGVNLNDSQNFEMPVITAMEESEQDSCSSLTSHVLSPSTSGRASHPQHMHFSTVHPPHNIQHYSPDTSEDPFAFNSGSEDNFVMPLRRKVGRRSGRGQGSSSSTRQPLGSSHTPPRTNVTRPLHVPSNPTGILPPVTPTTGSFNPPSILTTPPLSHSQRSTPRILNQSISDISLATPPSSSVTSTPASFFSSPSAFVQPQALDSMFNEHPNAPYIRLNHIATVTTTRQYISTEIVKPSGTVVHTEFNEVSSNVPQDYKQISFQVEPVYALPSSSNSNKPSTPPISTPLPSSPSVHNTTQSSSAGTPGCHGNTIQKQITWDRPSGAPPTSTSQQSTSSSIMMNPSPASRVRDATKKRSEAEVSTPPGPTSNAVHLLTQGSLVVAQWKNKLWYCGHVVQKVGKKVCISWMDGERDNISLQHVLPLSQLPHGTPVIADRYEDDPLQSEVHGSYQGLADGQTAAADTFKLTTTSGQTMCFNLSRLVLTSETAHMVTRVVAANTTSTGLGRAPVTVKFLSGYVFMLTEQKKDQLGTSENKRQVIEDMIKSHGGFVMDDYKHTHVLEKKTFCLSNTHCRTLKYFIALAINLPCVKYEWIRECVKQKKLISFEQFILPAGTSTRSKQIIYWKPRNQRFLNVSIYIHGDTTFKVFWGKVCTAGGAKILSKPPSKTRDAASRSAIPQSLKDLSGGLVHLVTSDWLVETLLHGTIQSL